MLNGSSGVEFKKKTANGIHFNTKLTMHSGSLSELLHPYEEKLRSETITHVCLVHNQSNAYRNAIETCSEDTVIIHVDFSESWKCRYASEIQACHFGHNCHS